MKLTDEEKAHYKAERQQVFKVYGVDNGWSVHHIVRRHDGFEPLGADIHDRSNLYPLPRPIHQIVEDMIDAGSIHRYYFNKGTEEVKKLRPLLDYLQEKQR